MRRLGIVAIFVLVLSMSVVTFSQGLFTLSPPAGGNIYPTESPSAVATIKAVLVKSYPPTGVSAWNQLNTGWASYGTTPIAIDTTTLASASFTYADLVMSGADVLILSNPSGGLIQFSTSEIAAVGQYASAGHNVVGTFLLLQWGSSDNRGLATIFGLRSELAYNTTGVSIISNTFNKLDTLNPLFNGISGSSWSSTGYPYTQVPSDRAWSIPGDFAGAVAVAQCDSNKGIITTYSAPNYSAVYISNMPEYGGNANDKQLLYNAITYKGVGVLPQFLITMNKNAYVNGDVVIANEFRLQNLGSNAAPVELKVWLEGPGISPIGILNLGADGSFYVPAGFNQNFGPVTLFNVSSALPRGDYQFNSRLINPTTGGFISEDINIFKFQ